MTFNRSSGALYEKKGRRSSGFNHTTVFPELRQGWRFEGREESERDLSERREKSDSRRYSSSSTPKQRKSGCLNSDSCVFPGFPRGPFFRAQRRVTSSTKLRQPGAGPSSASPGEDILLACLKGQEWPYSETARGSYVWIFRGDRQWSASMSRNL